MSGVGRVVGFLFTLAFYEVVGLGVYLGVFHTDALSVVAEASGPEAVPGALLGIVAANPDALVGATAGGALGFRSGYTGRIWASSDRSGTGYAGSGIGAGGFGGGGGGGSGSGQ